MELYTYTIRNGDNNYPALLQKYSEALSEWFAAV